MQTYNDKKCQKNAKSKAKQLGQHNIKRPRLRRTRHATPKHSHASTHTTSATFSQHHSTRPLQPALAHAHGALPALRPNQAQGLPNSGHKVDPQTSLTSCGKSAASLRFASGSRTRSTPARSAPISFSLMPPTGRTRPRRLTSPVMASEGARGCWRRD